MVQRSRFYRFRIKTINTSFFVNISISGAAVLEKYAFQTHILFALFCNFVPFKKGLALYFNNVNSLVSSQKVSLYSVQLNYPSGSIEEVKNEKVYKRTDKRTDNRSSEKLTYTFSTGGLKRFETHFSVTSSGQPSVKGKDK